MDRTADNTNSIASASGREHYVHTPGGPLFARGVAPELPKRKAATSAPGPVPAGGQWWEDLLPFRHYRATAVLDQEAYQELSRQFTLVLEATSSQSAGEFKLSRTSEKYDALILGMNKELGPAFAPFFAETWLRSLAHFLGLTFLPCVDGALHSNPQGNRTAYIHTDYCSAWFDESGSVEGELLFPDRSRCDYFNGCAKVPDSKPKEYIRAATLIFYLCNDGWKQGDGGETGLYGAARQTTRTAYRLVPPLNNSLLLFECSPHSYHRFVANPGRTRNSIILWLHSSVGDAQSRWGLAINRRGRS